MTIDAQPRIPLPQPPDAAQPYSFPVVACIAPVIGAVVIWAITRSSFTLVFAALGPIIAIASFLDSKLQARRRSKRDGLRFERQLLECIDSIDQQHARERAALLRLTPGSGDILAMSAGDPERWRSDTDSGVFVNLGTGTIYSEVRLDGAPRLNDDTADAALTALREQAAVLDDAPIVVDARLGIGICGPATLAMALARSILVQLATVISPANGGIAIPDGAGWAWLAGLPHPHSVSSTSAVRWSLGSDTFTISVAAFAELLPSDCRVVLRVGDGRRVELVRHASHEAGDFFDGGFVSAEEALRGVELLARAARDRGLIGAGCEPVSHDFAALPSKEVKRGTLRCSFAWHDADPLWLDLVTDGPHAVIGGTTGSGKSELLVSWVLAMAANAGPEQVNFLLVDFKGGSSFGPIEDLPHVVGLITDLDERSAHRALLSLRAELRFRERRLADAGARSIDDLPPGDELPRLVLVVDEFAAMVAGFPELHELFADLAARGRSLGLHLILCTQRPAGVVRDAVLANAALRISLRVNNRADSVAVIGNGDAAELSVESPGRALLSLAGSEPLPMQVARATAADVALIAGRRRSELDSIRRPWCDDLPTVIRLEKLDPVASGLPFGLLDLPEQQRQQTAVYEPEVDGNLLVVGGQRSGKSGLLATLQATVGSELLPVDIEASWDALSGAVDRVRRMLVGPRLLLVDDVDALIARFPEDYRAPFVDLLTELLREGGSVGLRVVITARRLPPSLQPLLGLCDSRLVLRLPNRQEHLLAGGTPGGFVSDGRPGAGEWRGSRLQLALAAAPQSMVVAAVISPLDFAEHRGLIVVSRRPAQCARRLRESATVEVIELGTTVRTTELSVVDAGASVIVVADPETWQSQWSLLASLRARTAILFDGCTPAEFRAVSGQRRLPPPLSSVSGSLWLLEPDGTLTRTQLR
ncbi:FtsK/SpoIIIE domain-containing protein [Glaciihabitans sp. UYNi722]|uniref:FtsK/SpoIIIE domain-containing protein n=1 Tax=Glaciihabitans sp. UYNi722 TaxID=3156344 RepID=UPI003395B53E